VHRALVETQLNILKFYRVNEVAVVVVVILVADAVVVAAAAAAAAAVVFSCVGWTSVYDEFYTTRKLSHACQ